MSWRRLACLLCLFALDSALRAAETNLVDRAVAAWKAGDHTNGLVLISAAIQAEPKESRLWNMRAQMRAMLGRRDEAVADLGEAIQVEPTSAWLHQERAQLLFRAGRIGEAVADFDAANGLSAKLVPQNWQRGIALYYAGRFADGRRQFEEHQTVNPNDVENAAWHFLCAARELGVTQAREKLIPIKGDTRVPMSEIHALFAGKGTVEAVLAAAERGEPASRDEQRFYAHLYLGLYHEALGNAGPARTEIELASKLAEHGGYMGAVARVHAARFATEAKKP